MQLHRFIYYIDIAHSIHILENDYENDYHIIMIIKIMCIAYMRYVTDINRLEITILPARTRVTFLRYTPELPI